MGCSGHGVSLDFEIETLGVGSVFAVLTLVGILLK
jgi:hypothetical protein